MTTPDDVARVLAQRLKFPSKPTGAPPISAEAQRIALALHTMASSIEAMTPERRAEVQRACAVVGVSIPVPT